MYADDSKVYQEVRSPNLYRTPQGSIDEALILQFPEMLTLTSMVENISKTRHRQWTLAQRLMKSKKLIMKTDLGVIMNKLLNLGNM